MPRKLTGRLVQAVTDPLWKRDVLEMRAANAVFALIEPKRKRRTRHAPAHAPQRPAKRSR